MIITNGLLRVFNYMLESFAESHPQQLTNPDSVRFFVNFQNKYYPVIDIKYIDWESVDIVVNPYLFCVNPSVADTPYKGKQFINMVEKYIAAKNGSHPFTQLSCSKLNFHLCGFGSKNCGRRSWEIDNDYSVKGIFVINLYSDWY